MIELLLVAPKAGLDVSEAFSVGELGKTHTKELIPAGEGFDFVVALDQVCRDSEATPDNILCFLPIIFSKTKNREGNS